MCENAWVMKLGVEALIEDPALRRRLDGRRVALLGHPGSVTHDLTHSLDALVESGVKLACAFGPQHGMRGEAQDNMVETDHYVDDKRQLPVYSLYGDTRRLTEQMLEAFDVLLVDLQDVGTRIYTFVTTTFWAMEECARTGKALWVLDRPNPAGRPVEGRFLRPGFESFVGPAPLPMRHGMTLGELARWYRAHAGLDVDLEVVAMPGYAPEAGPGYGWPVGELAWVNPSPNAATPNMPRCFPGTVVIEGTTLSEGRGTTRPLELLGAPDIDAEALLEDARGFAPEWFEGAAIRPCWFEPTFHKHSKQPCSGFQMHTDLPAYEHGHFRPYRIVAAFLKALRRARPEYEIWRDFLYEYAPGRLAVDLIDGSDRLRTWVDDPGLDVEGFEAELAADERAWHAARAAHLLY